MERATEADEALLEKGRSIQRQAHRFRWPVPELTAAFLYRLPSIAIGTAQWRGERLYPYFNLVDAKPHCNRG
jgi:hypothetical protein